jgi:hypothetical protein
MERIVNHNSIDSGPAGFIQRDAPPDRNNTINNVTPQDLPGQAPSRSIECAFRLQQIKTILKHHKKSPQNKTQSKSTHRRAKRSSLVETNETETPDD